MKWRNNLPEEIVEEVCKEFRIELAEEFKFFLSSHKRLSGVVDLEVEIFGKKKELAIEVIFNVIQFVRSISFRNSIPELIENEIVGIGYFLGSEFLGIGVGDSNFGKVFYSEVDFEDFTEIFSSFGSLLEELNKK